MKALFTPIITLVLALILAGCEGYSEIVGVTFTCTYWTVNEDGGAIFYMPPIDEEAPPPDSIALVLQVTDGDGTVLYSYVFTSEEDAEDFAETMDADYNVAYTTLPNYNPLNFRFFVVADGESYLLMADSGSCAGLPTYAAPDGTVSPPDDRINWQYGDLEAVVYSHVQGTVVYCSQAGGGLGMLITQDIVDNAPAGQPQDVPVLEANGCNAAFYILDSGEFQINIWTHEGKIYEIIADNIHFRNATKRYYDPNE